jgi:hypothetical protein
MAITYCLPLLLIAEMLAEALFNKRNKIQMQRCGYSSLNLLILNKVLCAFLFLQDEYQLVRDCLCGQMYDSSPVDFVSDLGTRFLLDPSVLKMSEPPRVLSWMAKGVASGLDALFINKFEEQRKDYWETLYSSVVCPFIDNIA